MPSKQQNIEKMKQIGVSDRAARAWATGKLTPADKAMLERLIQAGAREPFAVRAIQRGLTDNDIMWNQRLGRPAHFVEADKEVEAERREEWTRRHPPVPVVP